MAGRLSTEPVVHSGLTAVEPAHPGEARPAGGASPLQTVLQILLVVGALLLSLWALHQIAVVVVILITSALCAYVIAPLVDLAQQPIRIAGRPRRLTRGGAIALVYAALASAVGAGGVLLLPNAVVQATEAAASVPAELKSFLAWQHEWTRYYAKLQIPAEFRVRLDAVAESVVQAMLAFSREQAEALAGRATALPWVVMVPVLAAFLLKDARSIRRVIVLALPFRLRLRGHQLFDEVDTTLAAYVRAQVLACALVGTVCGVGFALLGVPYPMLLGVLAGLLEFIPLVGPFLLAALATLFALLHAPITALWTVVFLAVLRLAEDYAIYPRLMRHGLELHPLAVIVGVMAGAELDGVVGMFLAVPAVATATVVVRHWISWRTADDEARAAMELSGGEVGVPVGAAGGAGE